MSQCDMRVLVYKKYSSARSCLSLFTTIMAVSGLMLKLGLSNTPSLVMVEEWKEDSGNALNCALVGWKLRGVDRTAGTWAIFSGHCFTVFTLHREVGICLVKDSMVAG